MSLDQGAAFAQGLKKLSEDFKAESKGYTDAYKAEVKAASDKFEAVYPQVKEAAVEFQEASHDYAKNMVAATDEYVHDIQELYQSIYDEAAKKD